MHFFIGVHTAVKKIIFENKLHRFKSVFLAKLTLEFYEQMNVGYTV